MAAARARVREYEAAAPRSDAYTGMLLISLLALIAGCILLFLDYNQYPSAPPAKVTPTQPPARVEPPTEPPPGGGGAQNPAPGGGQPGTPMP